MRLIKPSIEYLDGTANPLRAIESAGRTCYKSEDAITDDSAPVFIRKLIDRGHLAMIEHAYASYRVVCDRGVTHEIVRHRLFSYAQESTRYCNYKGGVTFVLPPWIDLEEGEYATSWGEVGIRCSLPVMDISAESARLSIWAAAMGSAEIRYQDLLKRGWSPQQARSVLPNSLKTEIVITGNLREWMHFFGLRTSKKAHPQMQEVANMLLADIKTRVPVIFESFGQ